MNRAMSRSDGFYPSDRLTLSAFTYPLRLPDAAKPIFCNLLSGFLCIDRRLGRFLFLLFLHQSADDVGSAGFAAVS